MANEFKHKDVGDEITKAEYHSILAHIADAQAAGDILYCNGTAWKRLAKGGAAGLYLKCDGAPYWEAILAGDLPAHAPQAHAASHENGGADEIDVAGLSGELADNQPPKAHTHTKIQDADGDTRVDVEEAADEDKIRMHVKGVEAFLLHDDGILTLAKQSSAAAYQTVDQTIPNLTDTKINFNIEDYDIQSEFDLVTDRFTAKKAGVYVIDSKIQMWNIDAGKYIMVKVFKNGASVRAGEVISPAAGINLVCFCPTVLSLAATDFVEFYIKHNVGANRDTFSGIDRVYFSIVKVA